MIILGIIRAQLFLTISNSFIDSFRTKKSKTNNRSAMFIPEFTLIQKCRLSYFLTVAMTAKVQLGRGHQRVSGSVAKMRRSIKDSYNVKRCPAFSPNKRAMSEKQKSRSYE